MSLNSNWDGENDDLPIWAGLDFEPGDELYDLDDADYNVVGGWWKRETGQFSALNPYAFPVNKISKLPATTKSPSCWKLITKWIHDCSSKHESCREVYQSGWTPSRLVDTAHFGSGYIRVVTTSTEAESIADEYLAFSHCWGRQPFLVLEEHNQKEFETGVPISSLPPNFQDAMLVTRELGFRYIWIDSLCIIQGSKGDWEEHAPLMNMVYRNAVLTLGAVASPDAQGGLFRNRDPDLVSPCPFQFRSEEKGVVDCLLVKADFWENEVRQAPLSRRAWVLQERVLAPRSLYFGQSQLFWECRELYACEVFPGGMPTEFVGDIKYPGSADAVSIKAFRKTLSWFLDPTITDRSGDDRQYDTPYGVWDNILHSYVKCALTKTEDKLVAISGIVKDFADIVGDEYLAGLWRNHFIDGLLWRIGQEPLTGEWKSAVRPDRYRAPTWSWASVDAPYTEAHACHFGFDDKYAEIVDVHVIPKAGDPTSQLKHACLHVRGHLIKIRHVPERRFYNHYFGEFHPDMEPLEGRHFFCFPLREEASASGTRSICGLVLTPCLEFEQEPEEAEEKLGFLCSKCSDEQIWTRVGTFECDQGDPLKYLTMVKPDDWDDWGEASDHLWFPEEAPKYEFVII